jgi:hypothetical protein
MKVQVTVDGETSDVEVEFASLTLQESVSIEEALGADGYDRFIADTESGNPFQRPSSIRALLFAKLSAGYPGLAITDVDVDMASLMESDDDLGKGDSDSE